LLSGLSVSQAVDFLIPAQANIPALAPPINNYQGSQPDAAGVAYGQTWVNSALQWNVSNHPETGYARIYGSLKNWQAGTYIKSNTSIAEKMVLFWYHFIPVQLFQLEQQSPVGINAGRVMYNYLSLLRNNCLGNFKTMIRKICTDPAMMNYLSNQNNTAAEPNENFARELFELFTLGKGPESQYTETDVAEAAKVLTGWLTVNFEQLNTVTNFVPERHSQENKTFSSFFNNTVITGRTGATGGQLELDDLLNMIFSQQEVSKFIVRKIYRWFVYYQIDAATEANVIGPLAEVFRNNNYEMKPLLATLFKSEHFFDVLNSGCYIKSPSDHVIGALREMNTQFPVLTDWDSNYRFWNVFYSWMANTGQILHDPPNVSGLPAFYQEPSFHELWINADSLPKRNQFTDTMISFGYTANGNRVQFNCVAFAQTLSNPGNPNDLIDEALKYFFRNDLSAQSKAQIKTQILLTGQQWDYYWTNAWAAWVSSPTTANFNIINTRLKNLFQYFFNLSEYQLS